MTMNPRRHLQCHERRQRKICTFQTFTSSRLVYRDPGWMDRPMNIRPSQRRVPNYGITPALHHSATTPLLEVHQSGDPTGKGFVLYTTTECNNPTIDHKGHVTLTASPTVALWAQLQALIDDTQLCLSDCVAQLVKWPSSTMHHLLWVKEVRGSRSPLDSGFPTLREYKRGAVDK